MIQQSKQTVLSVRIDHCADGNAGRQIVGLVESFGQFMGCAEIIDLCYGDLRQFVHKHSHKFTVLFAIDGAESLVTAEDLRKGVIHLIRRDSLCFIIADHIVHL